MTKSMRDEDLMLEVRDGAGETLGVLFDRYQYPLFNFYSKMNGRPQFERGLVQEVFLRILKVSPELHARERRFVPGCIRSRGTLGSDHFRKQRPETNWSAEIEPRVPASDPAQTKQEASLLYRAADAIAGGKERSPRA